MKVAINELTGIGMDYAVAEMTGALGAGVYAVAGDVLHLFHIDGSHLRFNPSGSLSQAGHLMVKMKIKLPDDALAADVPRLACKALLSRAGDAAIDMPRSIVMHMLAEGKSL